MPSVVRWDHFFRRYPQQMARPQRKASEAAPAAGEIFQPSARVIDGMVLVLWLKSDHKKITDIGDLCLQET